MSTKIHNGVRVPLARLNEFLEAVAKITVEHAAVDIFRIINHQVPPEKVDAWIKEDIDPERYEGYSSDEQTMARCRIVYLRLAGFFGAGAEDQNIWNLYNKQAGWSLFIHGRYVYGWPWGEYVQEVSEEVRKIDWVQYYGYWNSSDKPQETSSREWESRRKAWDTILTGDMQYRHRLSYSTVDYKGGHFSAFMIRDRVYELQQAAIEGQKGEAQPA